MKRKTTVDRKESYRTDKYEFCNCPTPFVVRFEDFTYKLLGQEITRNIEVEFCPLCDEKWIDGASAEEMKAEIEAKVLSLANERCEVPEGYEWMKYYDDVDILFVSYGNSNSVISDDDISKGLIYDFDRDGKLTGIEILNFYGKLKQQKDFPNLK